MKDDTRPSRFYRLVYFSPRPEDGEKVCLAVLIKDSKRIYLEYDPRFDKARCLAPDYSVESLKFTLEAIKDKAEAGLESPEVAGFSPQFKLSEPRNILQPVDERVREVLRHRFLLRVRTPRRSDEKERGMGPRIDQFLFDRIKVLPSQMKRRASFSELFGPGLERSLPKDLVPKTVSRAIAFEDRVVLLEGVNLHTHSTELLVDRVARIVHAFWQYREAWEYSSDLRSTRLTRTAILFNGDGKTVIDEFKWRRDYAWHEFEKDADITLEPGTSSSENKLRQELEPALFRNG